MKLRRSFFAFVLVTCAGCSLSETPSVHYPGITNAADTAMLFAPGIISTDAFEHSAPAISADGKIILWSVVDLPSWRARLWEITYENGNWSEPHSPSFADTSASDSYPSFADDNTLYFSSSRRLPSGATPQRGNVLWRVDRSDHSWGVPEPLDSAVSTGGDYAPSISSDGDLYFTHGPFRSPDWNIQWAEYTAATRTFTLKTLSNINSDGYDDGPFIAPDETYLIFESDRPGGIGESIDLYISFKSEEGMWSLPINMGSRINTLHSERFARVSPDGKYLFFGSDRRHVDGKGNFDIYWMKSSIIDQLRSKINFTK